MMTPLSDKGQQRLFQKIEALREEISGCKPLLADAQLGRTISNNIEFAQREIKGIEEMLLSQISLNEWNQVLQTLNCAIQ